MSYLDLIARKAVKHLPSGFADASDLQLNAALFPHQDHSTRFALAQGRGALFLDTGLGKTFCALEWGRVIMERTNKPVLMLAPLAVSAQHEAEALRRGVDARAVREPEELTDARIYITNYERLHKFDASGFAGVVLDESSILKSFTGATTRQLIETFASTPYRLACTATPAPNDHMELGQHSQFLGAMNSNEMLARWFIADQTQMGRYRLKSGAVRPFWNWVASWARCIAKPSDIGFSDAGFVLPELKLERHIIAADRSELSGAEKDGQARLFRIPDTSATSIHREKRLTISGRADKIAELVAAEPNEAWVIWCDTDYEADALNDRITDAIEVRGSMSAEKKEALLMAFSSGAARVIITKPSIAGFGLNWQHCARMAFVGLSFSYEMFYQAIRRCWRFGQPREVHVHVAMADTERDIWSVVSRKSDDHGRMKHEMAAAMARAMLKKGVLETYLPTEEVEWPQFIRRAS